MSLRIIEDGLEFEVPYGKLTAKTWYEETDESKRVLLLHGWMDNCGSFDHLVPLIKHKESLYIVGLDLPGHGRSSQLLPGSSYSDLILVMEIRRFLTELEWIQPVDKNRKLCKDEKSQNTEQSGNKIEIDIAKKQKKFSIIGHSLGAYLGLFYASLYPDDVDEVILLDFIKTRTLPVEKLVDVTAETIDNFLHTVPSVLPSQTIMNNRASVGLIDKGSKFVDKGQVIVSRETAIVATIEAHRNLGSLSRDQALCLLKRSTIDVSSPANSVLYFRDLRLHHMIHMREHTSTNNILFARVKCHAISILAERGIYSNGDSYSDGLKEMEETLKSRCESFSLQWMADADHFMLMNEPQRTAHIINKYLEAPQDYKVT